MTAITQDAPQHEHGITGKLHFPRKYLGGCEDPEFYMAPLEGDCLMPEINSGEMVLVSPAAAPEPGDFIIIWPTAGKPCVKRLTLRLSQYRSPHQEVTAMSCPPSSSSRSTRSGDTGFPWTR
jgi:SOS-response transcriptional repressor LexA